MMSPLDPARGLLLGVLLGLLIWLLIGLAAYETWELVT